MKRYFGGRFLPFDFGSVNPPASGVRTTNASWCVCEHGLQRNDVVVAIDGTQVTSYEQYMVLFYRSFEDDAWFTVWRDKAYVDVKGPLRWYVGHDLNVEPFGSAPSVH
jgi:hypothetical protein